MSFTNSEPELTGFSGIARLFPLPNLVLYPGVIQPLHIFEPRYRQMMRHAIEGDQLIATALYKPDWDISLDDSPAVHNVVCIGKIMTHIELEDGRFNLLLKGLSRARIRREISTELSYRIADVELITEPQTQFDELVDLRSKLVANYFALAQQLASDTETIHQLTEKDLPLGTLVDLIAFAIDLIPDQQQEILSTVDIKFRAIRLLELLENKFSPECTSPKSVACEFPPEFSYN